MNSLESVTAPVSSVETSDQGRVKVKLLYAACVVLGLLSLGFVVAIILVGRQLFFNNG